MSSLHTDMCISCGSLNVSLEHPLFIGAMCQGCKVRHALAPSAMLNHADTHRTVNRKVDAHWRRLLWLFHLLISWFIKVQWLKFISHARNKNPNNDNNKSRHVAVSWTDFVTQEVFVVCTELLPGVRVSVRRRWLPVLLHHLLWGERGAHVWEQQLLQVCVCRCVDVCLYLGPLLRNVQEFWPCGDTWVVHIGRSSQGQKDNLCIQHTDKDIPGGLRSGVLFIKTALKKTTTYIVAYVSNLGQQNRSLRGHVVRTSLKEEA